MKQSIGANFLAEKDKCEFTVWAPFAKQVTLEIYSPTKKNVKLKQDEWGYWAENVEGTKPGTLYKFKVDNKDPLPDPASLSQPEGPHGASEVVDKRFNWSDQNWKGIQLKDLIIYELHTGTFSPEGTFEGIIKKLDYLLELGVNAIEIMPVSQFPGGRNWGYDGVYPYATQSTYGGVKGLQNLVNECHKKGIAVILDVVYNHLGPEGNYLSQYGPYFTDKYHTPWGQAINFDDAYCDPVRTYFIQNALMWYRDFHIDGLRLDAVHAIKDLSAKHFLQELSEEIETLEQELNRHIFTIAECDLNDRRYIRPTNKEGYGLDAQWIDEFHHALHAYLTGEQMGYYEDFGDFDKITKAFEETFVYNGVYSPHRKKVFGSTAETEPLDKFVVFSQNHDQVGNRMLGERLTKLVPFEALKATAAAVILSPYIPMLFMGEEWAEDAPFLYFISHTDSKLVEAVQKGRKREFQAFHAKGNPPDPQSEETFNKSKLNWNFKEDSAKKAIWEFYKTLITLRKQSPAFKNPDRTTFHVYPDERSKTLTLCKANQHAELCMILNFNNKGAEVRFEPEKGSYHLILNSADKKWNGPGMEAPGIVKTGDTVAIAPYTVLVYQK